MSSKAKITSILFDCDYCSDETHINLDPFQGIDMRNNFSNVAQHKRPYQ
jgi:hypothetical protein